MLAETFFDRARARLSLDTPAALHDPAMVPDKGDHELNLEMKALWAVRPIRPAAVLVPVVDRALRLHPAKPDAVIWHTLMVDRVRELSSSFDVIDFHIDPPSERAAGHALGHRATGD